MNTVTPEHRNTGLQVCLRLDLDYVPWDVANATQYGHGEPAMILRLLNFARATGIKFHFFISNRSLRTFPTTADAVLGEGHDLDLFCRYPDDGELLKEARSLFALAGYKFVGLATDLPLPESFDTLEIQFVTGPAGSSPTGPAYFPITGYADEEALPLGLGPGILSAPHLGDVTPESMAVIVARPQVLAKHDPTLKSFGQLVDAISHAKIQIRTLRDAVSGAK